MSEWVNKIIDLFTHSLIHNKKAACFKRCGFFIEERFFTMAMESTPGQFPVLYHLQNADHLYHKDQEVMVMH